MRQHDPEHVQQDGCSGVMNNSCIERFILGGPDIRSRDSYIVCYICVQLLQHVSLTFSFCGVFVWGSGCSAVETPRLMLVSSVVSFGGRGARLWRHPG